MSEVLGVEKRNELKTISFEKDTLILELPAEVCKREGFTEGTMVSLTFKDGGILSSIIRPSTEIENFVNQIIEEDSELHETLKRLGD